MRFDISQGNYEWTDKDYIGKKLGFYRLTAAGAKDSTFAPAQQILPLPTMCVDVNIIFKLMHSIFISCLRFG